MTLRADRRSKREVTTAGEDTYSAVFHPFSMTIRDAAFSHWPIEPDRVRPHVPFPLELETFDGKAWLSAVSFVLARAGLARTPSGLRWTGPELNLRTYVRVDDVSGLYFFSIDLDDRLLAPLARAVLGVNCYHAVQQVDRDDTKVRFSSIRTADGDAAPATFRAAYEPTTEPVRTEPGTLQYWLSERRRLFTPRGRFLLTGEIAHERWPLRDATASIETNTLFEAAALPTPAFEPRCYYCEELTVSGSIIRPFRSRSVPDS